MTQKNFRMKTVHIVPKQLKTIPQHYHIQSSGFLLLRMRTVSHIQSQVSKV